MSERERGERYCIRASADHSWASHITPVSDSELRRPCLSPIRASWFDLIYYI